MESERWIGTESKRARELLGKNFFGAEEWVNLGAGPVMAKSHIKKSMHFPWKEEVLISRCPFIKDKQVRETHFAFLGIGSIFEKPLTIAEWYARNGRFGVGSRPLQSWCAYQDFVRKNTCEVRWYLMPLAVGLMLSLAGKTYAEQMKELGDDYEVSSAVELFTKNILFRFMHGIFPDSLMHLRCRDVAPSGNLVQIRFFDKNGPDIASHWDGSRMPRVGIAASRKLPR